MARTETVFASSSKLGVVHLAIHINKSGDLTEPRIYFTAIRKGTRPVTLGDYFLNLSEMEKIIAQARQQEELAWELE